MALLKRALTLSLVCSSPCLAAPLPSSSPVAPNPLSTAVPIPLGRGADTQLLERSLQKLDAELRALDQLIPTEPEPAVRDVLATPELPPNLLRANEPAQGPIQP